MKTEAEDTAYLDRLTKMPVVDEVVNLNFIFTFS